VVSPHDGADGSGRRRGGGGARVLEALAMREVAVIADDLTGAADCGIAFAVAGVTTFVAFAEGPVPARARVVAIDTDSRQLSRAGAEERARAAGRRAVDEGWRTIYRKIDSTLRGHVGAELAATLAVAGRAEGQDRLLVVAPAFPAVGRTTQDGRVLVGGVPLDETEVWRKSGMAGPSEPASMLRVAGVPSEVAPLATVRAGPEALAGTLAELVRRGVRAVVCDAAEEGDLTCVAEAGARLAIPPLWAGSAGLARHLPAALGLAREASAPAAIEATADGPVLLLVGSRSSVSREQARRVAAQPDVETIALPPEDLLAGGPDLGRASARVAAALAAGRDVLVLISLETVLGLEQGPALAAALARLAAAHVSMLRGLVATGGDVARAALQALGASGIELVGEVEPGIPLGLARGARTLPVVTKAGAFGSEEALSRCRAALRRAPAAPGRS